MTRSKDTSAPSPQDPAVQAEWQRIEAERLAEERAEAREDAEEVAGKPAPPRTDRRWMVPALLVALIAGVAMTILVNAPESVLVSESNQSAAVKRALVEWAEAELADEAALTGGNRVRRIASSADVPTDQLTIRVGLRDEKGRDRLESLLAASGLRIESDRDSLVEELPETAVDRLVVAGPPAAVDALLDRLIASPAMLAVQSPSLVAVVPDEPVQAGEPDEPGEPDAAAADVPKRGRDTDAEDASPAEAGQSGVPMRVRLRIEVVDLPADPPPAPAAVEPAATPESDPAAESAP